MATADMSKRLTIVKQEKEPLLVKQLMQDLTKQGDGICL